MLLYIYLMVIYRHGSNSIYPKVFGTCCMLLCNYLIVIYGHGSNNNNNGLFVL